MVFASSINTAITIAGDRPALISKFMTSKHGNQPIEYVVFQRTPVIKAVQKLINVVSGDSMEKAKKSNNYDDYYHLSGYWKIKGLDVLVKMEKVAKVEFKLVKNMDKTGEKFRVDVNNGSTAKQHPVLGAAPEVTFKQMIEKTEQLYKQQGLGPYRYSATKNNCQLFQLNLLTSIGKDTEEAKNFILQDTSGVLGNDKKLEGVSNVITNTAGVAQAMFGGKKQRMKSYIHSVGFDKDYWTASQCRAWLKKHDLQPLYRMSRYGNQLRYEIADDKIEGFKRYSTKKTKDNIIIVFGYK